MAKNELFSTKIRILISNITTSNSLRKTKFRIRIRRGCFNLKGNASCRVFDETIKKIGRSPHQTIELVFARTPLLPFSPLAARDRPLLALLARRLRPTTPWKRHALGEIRVASSYRPPHPLQPPISTSAPAACSAWIVLGSCCSELILLDSVGASRQRCTRPAVSPAWTTASSRPAMGDPGASSSSLRRLGTPR